MDGIGAALEMAFKVMIAAAVVAGIAIGACGSCVARHYAVRIERKP